MLNTVRSVRKGEREALRSEAVAAAERAFVRLESREQDRTTTGNCNPLTTLANI